MTTLKSLEIGTYSDLDQGSEDKGDKRVSKALITWESIEEKNTDLRCLESVFYFSPVLSCSLTPVRALSLVLQRLTPPYPSSTHAG